MAKKKSRIASLITDIVILVVLAVILGVSMVWSHDIELKLGLLHYVDASTVDESEIVVLDKAAHAESYSATLNLHYVDVGQGDCTIIELPDGKTMIIDGGEEKKAVKTAISDYIEKELPEDFTYFDYAILTHADSDHCGSLDDVLVKYPARVSYRPNVESNYTGYTDPGKADLTEGAEKKNTLAYKNAIDAMYYTCEEFTSIVYVTNPYDEAQTISGGEGEDKYTFTFYSPLSVKYTDSNDYSPIMILSYRGFNFALSGDAEKKNEEEFVAMVKSSLAADEEDKYDIFTDSYTVNAIKCGHHGSRTSTSQAYIDAITTPEGAKAAYYIISSGNQYGHPHKETLDRLAAMGVPEENILRTDTLGHIMLSVHCGDDGKYSLYYGDKSSDVPTTPTNPDKPNPDDTNGEETENTKVLVYRKLGGIKLTWAVVAWTCYAVVVVFIVIGWIAVGMRGGKKR